MFNLERWQARDPFEGFTLMDTFTTDQRAYRFRNDDGSQTTATWKDVQNAPISAPMGSSFRLRVEIQETGNGSSNNVNHDLQYRVNTGAWTDITSTSSVVHLTSSSFVANETPTTNQLTAGTGTFRPGSVVTAVSVVRTSYSGSDHTEYEWCIFIDDGSASGGDTIEFRVLLNGVVTNSVTATPTLTVEATAPPTEAPTLSSPSKTHNSIDLSWTTVSGGETYELQRDTVTIQNTSATTRNDTGLTPEVQYTYRVRGVNSGGEGPWSNELQVTTDAEPPPGDEWSESVFPEENSNIPPITVGSDTYAIAIDGQDAQTFYVFKSSDPTDSGSWAAVAQDSISFEVIQSISWVLEGTTIHIALKGDFSEAQYHSFNTGSETLSTAEQISLAPTSLGAHMASIDIALSDGEPTAAYAADWGLGDGHAVEWRHRDVPSGGQWTGHEQFLDGSDGWAYAGRLISNGSNTIYGFYVDLTMGPWNVWYTEIESLQVGSPVVLDTAVPQGFYLHELSNAVKWDNGETGDDYGVLYLDEFGDLGFVAAFTAAEFVASAPMIHSDTLSASLVADDSGNLHAIYVDGAGDVRYIQRLGVDDWGNDQELHGTGTTTRVHAIWDNGKIKYLWDDDGVLTYSELSIGGLLRTNSFEGGTAFASITTGNSGGASGDAFDSVAFGAAEFSNERAYKGLLSAKIVDVGAGAMVWSGFEEEKLYSRAYVLHEFDDPMNQMFQEEIIVYGGGDHWVQFELDWMTGTNVVLSVPTLGVEGEAQIPMGQWFRVEMLVDTAIDYLEVRLFLDPDGTTPDEIISGTLFFSTDPTELIWWGNYNGGTGLVYYDEVAISGQDWIGPVEPDEPIDTGLPWHIVRYDFEGITVPPDPFPGPDPEDWSTSGTVKIEDGSLQILADGSSVETPVFNFERSWIQINIEELVDGNLFFEAEVIFEQDVSTLKLEISQDGTDYIVDIYAGAQTDSFLYDPVNHKYLILAAQLNSSQQTEVAVYSSIDGYRWVNLLTAQAFWSNNSYVPASLLMSATATNDTEFVKIGGINTFDGFIFNDIFAPHVYGSFQGRTNVIRNSTGVLYAVLHVRLNGTGSDGGAVTVWRSDDEGVTWTQMDPAGIPYRGHNDDWVGSTGHRVDPVFSDVGIALDSNDIIHMSWLPGGKTEGGYGTFDTNVDKYGFHERIILEHPESGEWSQTGLAVDDNDDVHIAFGFFDDGSGGGLVEYARKLSGYEQWNTIIIEDTQDIFTAINEVEMGVDSEGIPYAIYNYGGDLYIAIADGAQPTNFSIHVVATNVNSSSGNLRKSIDHALHSNGDIDVVYINSSGNLSAIRHLVTNDWDTWQTTQTNGRAAISVNVFVHDGASHIFYHSNSSSILEYDVFTGTGFVGEQTVIDVSPEDMGSNVVRGLMRNNVSYDTYGADYMYLHQGDQSTVFYGNYSFGDGAPSGTGAISGGGSLESSGGKVITGSAAISGGGSLSSVGAKQASGVIQLSGGGNLSSQGIAERSGTSSISGGGTLSSTGTAIVSGTSTIFGGGSLSSDGIATRSGEALLSGGGTIASTGSAEVSGTASISSGGSLTSAGVASRDGTSYIAGGGEVSSAGFVIEPTIVRSDWSDWVEASTDLRSGTSYMSGGGNLSSAGAKGVDGTAVISGGGRIVNTGSIEGSGTASVSGGGILSSDGAAARSGAIVFSGGGSLSVVGIASRAGNNAISGGGTILPGGQAVRTGTSYIAGGGSITSDGVAVGAGTSYISGGGALNSEGVATREGTSYVSGGGFVSSIGSKEISGSSYLSGGGRIISTARNEGRGHISGAGTLSSIGVSARFGTSHVVGGGELNASGTKSVDGTTHITSSGSVASTGQASVAGTGYLSGGGALVSEGSASRAGISYIVGGGTLRATGGTATTGFSAISGGGAINVTGITNRAGSAYIVGGGSISNLAVVARFGEANVVGGGSISGIGAASRNGTSHLSGGGALASQGASLRTGSSYILGGGTISSDGTAGVGGKARISGGGSISSAGIVSKAGSSHITGAGSIVVDSAMSRSGSSHIVGGGTLSVDGFKLATSSTYISGGGNIEFAGSAFRSGASSVSGGGSISSAGATAGASAIKISGGGSISSTGEVARSGQLLISGGGTLSSQGDVSRTGTAYISGGGRLESEGEKHAPTADGTAKVSGGGSVSCTGHKGAAGTIKITGAGVIVNTGIKGSDGASALSGGGDITFTATSTRFGTAQISGGGTIRSDTFERDLRATTGTVLHRRELIGVTITRNSPGANISIKKD